MMFGSRARTPRASQAVVTSAEVGHGGMPVGFVSRSSSDDWLLLSGYESDASEPIALHFSHVRDEEPSLWTLRLRTLHYAPRYGPGTEWHVSGPVSDAVSPAGERLTCEAQPDPVVAVALDVRDQGPVEPRVEGPRRHRARTSMRRSSSRPLCPCAARAHVSARPRSPLSAASTPSP